MSHRPQRLPVAHLAPGPHAKYRLVEREHLEGLAASLLQGQEEALIVRPLGTPGTPGARLQVVVGERRRQALLLAGIQAADMVIGTISENEAHRLSAEHNANTTNTLERAEGVLRTIAAKLTARYKWKDVAAVYPSQLHAVRALINASVRTDQSELHAACKQLGYRPEAFKKLVQDALDLYYGEGKRNARTFAAGNALLTTYPEPLRAKMRLGELEASHAQAISQVTDPVLRAELLHRATRERLSVAALRALALEANLNGRLARDPGVEQLEIVVAEAQRALAKRPALSPRSLSKATRLATDLKELLNRRN